MRAVFILTCVLIAIGFGALAALPWLHQPDAAAPVREAVADTAAPLPGLPQDPVPTDLAAITERPLFTAVRRPPPPEAPGVPVVDPDAALLFGAYEITGVVMLGDNAIAMLRTKDGRLIRVRAGDNLPTDEGDVTLTAITLNALTFGQGADTLTVPVKREGTTSE